MQVKSLAFNHPHYTYRSNHLKVLLPLEINGFPIEKPLEVGIQRWITGHLTRQNEALSNGGIQTQRRNYNLDRIYSVKNKKEEKKKKFFFLLFTQLYIWGKQSLIWPEKGNQYTITI